jgi:hypothetical protein
MQLEKLGKTHEKLLQKEFSLSLDEFKKLSYEQMDKMVCLNLIWIADEDDNSDQKTASEIIDIIYGPYDESLLNMTVRERWNSIKYPQNRACPCCGKENMLCELDYDICRNCGWEDDPLQRDDPDYTGANGYLTLNEAKKMLAEGKKIYEGFPKEENAT